MGQRPTQRSWLTCRLILEQKTKSLRGNGEVPNLALCFPVNSKGLTGPSTGRLRSLQAMPVICLGLYKAKRCWESGRELGPEWLRLITVLPRDPELLWSAAYHQGRSYFIPFCLESIIIIVPIPWPPSRRHCSSVTNGAGSPASSTWPLEQILTTHEKVYPGFISCWGLSSGPGVISHICIIINLHCQLEWI